MRARRWIAMYTLYLFALIGSSRSALKAFDPLFPQRKTWWTKTITPYLFTAGRITDTQMKHAADVGFKSIISHFHFTENITIGSEVSYSTDVARYIAENIAGLEYAVLFTNNESEEPRQISGIEHLTNVINKLDKPILYHSRSTAVTTGDGDQIQTAIEGSMLDAVQHASTGTLFWPLVQVKSSG
ncbi:hypothetical protein CAPTEDRAFT_201201 [Capitella teleta]|uniref:Uncharacterized protein n=1 Tax=Capitella teleta TaxID=283909 RepID=R7UYK0_CAPTE|nr:hypothetical protein CAPTEDRAFT_201201 [Capitella teleta]|eukprot:ELU11638.1 hypothetical protein CAPTEDRAFT_201201 [Capitella teleta]